jgi:hypothetical protein
MLTALARPKLPGTLQRDIRSGFVLRPTRGVSDRSGLGSGLAPGWKEAKAPDGRVYYFHEKSGEVKWERPAKAGSSDSVGESRPQMPSSAVVVAARPVIPGVAGLAKLPRGWRMITGADGRPYYFNKKTNEVSWEPPPPVAEGDEADAPKDMAEKMSEVQDRVKEGFRRAKQTAAVKVFKATSTADPEADAMYERVLQVELQISSIKQTVEAHLASLVEMCWSATPVPLPLPPCLSPSPAVALSRSPSLAG